MEEGGSTAGQPRDPDLLLFVPREVSLIPVGLGPSQAWKRAISANCSLTFPTLLEIYWQGKHLYKSRAREMEVQGVVGRVTHLHHQETKLKEGWMLQDFSFSNSITKITYSAQK